MQAGNNSDIASQRSQAMKTAGVASLGHDASGGLRSDAVDSGQQFADLVLHQPMFNIALERPQPTAQQADIFAGVTYVQLIGLAVMSSDRLFGCFDQGPRQLLTDMMTAVVNQLGQFFERNAAAVG